MKTSLTYALAAAELLAALICLLLLYGNKFETRRKTKRSMIYSVMAATNTVALLSDAVSWLFDGKAAYTVVLNISTTISVVLSMVLIAQFDLYIWYLIGEHKQFPVKMMHFALSFCSISAALTLICCVGGWIFTYENGVYQTGPLYGLYVLVNMICLVVDAAFVLHFQKELYLHDRIAVFSYMLLPVVSAVFTIIFPDYSFSYVACTLSLVILYIMLQSEQGRQLEKEQELSHFFAMHDELTGVNSRRAYTEKLTALVKEDGNVGVAFCDVNALKYFNDHIGHEAGDNRLKTFTTELITVFHKENVYRISGDEFVVLMPAAKREVFNKLIAKLAESIDADDCPIASIGYGYGTCRNVYELVHNSELTMYVQKNAFHEKFPEMQR